MVLRFCPSKIEPICGMNHYPNNRHYMRPNENCQNLNHHISVSGGDGRESVRNATASDRPTDREMKGRRVCVDKRLKVNQKPRHTRKARNRQKLTDRVPQSQKSASKVGRSQKLAGLRDSPQLSL